MPEKIKLSNEDRRFISLIKEAAVANPFSDDRKILDIEITTSSPETNREQLTKKLIEAVTKKVEDLEKKGITNIYQVHEQDRDLVELLILFKIFYEFRKNFDHLITSQMETEDKNIKLRFGSKAREELEKWGFSQDTIRNSFEEAFQLRRAFYFIQKGIIGKSHVMKKLRSSLWNNIFTNNINIYRKYLKTKMEDFSTLLLGGTGTGKGAVATAIGRSGYIPYDLKKQRFTESFTSSFLSINLSQFPQTLIESELFGHKKGSFTGAIENYEGVFKRCSPHGSIFLDEIGDVSIPIQVKLLQVLQDRVFHPVGSYKKERFYGRVIAATNLPINKIREEGLFRDDFYYRLCSDIIIVPSLYERIQSHQDELTDLISFLIKRMLGKASPELVEMVYDVIDKQLGKDYPWPGNVRELEQCIRIVLIKNDYKGDEDNQKNSFNKKIESEFKNGKISAQDLINAYCKILYDKHGTFEEVAKITSLDRRTVTKYIKEWDKCRYFD